MAERVGQQLGNYRLVSLLGEGGFAEVYLGEHIHLGTQAAIKVLHAQLTSNEMEQFRLEARTIAHLEHPHIVRILDFGIEGKTPFLVMSYAPNGTLHQRHPKGAVLPVMTIVSYMRQIADALQYAHDEKLIHRDIKPENMLIGRRNEVLLSDFGIALIAQTSRYQSTQDVIGTVAYMAPEQIQGKPRPASDQYALGIVVYEWLSGDRPFHGSFTELCAQHMFASPPSLQQKISTISPEVEQVVQTALAKDPHQRFASVQAFATALEQVCLPVQHLPIVSPSQPLEPTVVAIPPTQHVWPTIADASLSQPPEPAVISTPSIQGERTKSGVSRRAVLAGLGGLAVIGIIGSITWLARSQSSRISPVSSGSNRTFTTTSTPTLAPNSPPLGATLLTYRGHSDWMTSVAWSPDDRSIASSSNDQTAQVWDAINGKTIFTYHGHSSGVNAAAWSPSGKRIASGSNDTTVQVWDTFNGSNVLTYRGHTDVVRTAAWSPDGTHIAAGGHDATAQVWDASNGKTIFFYHGHSSRVTSIAWSPDGKRIASASDDTTLQIWDAFNGSNVLTYRGHTQAVVKVAWSPDGTHIASASDDRTAQVWDGATGRNIVIYRGHSDAVDAVAWSPDGQQVASSSNDHTVQIWNATSGSTIFTYRGHSANIDALGWSHSGTRIVSGDDSASVQVWQAS
jgi:WD40 repeat protein